MKTVTKKTYRPVVWGMVIALSNNKLIAYVNTGGRIECSVARKMAR